MQKYYLAVDIGASSGRHMLAHMEQGKMVLEEIHRFPNGMLEENGELYWDVDQLFAEIKIGMKKCALAGKIPVSMGIDTWAVDFVLLDENNQRIGNAVAYRDKRTDGIEEYVYSILPEKELYGRTGIQKQKFNTIYQLMALKQNRKAQLEKAKKLLMIPDYFHYLLGGEAVTEYTNATTTQLVNPATKQWDWELMEKLGFPKEIFAEIRKPGSELSELKEEIQKEVGFNCKIILPATHDTGSAVMAVPSMDAASVPISAKAVPTATDAAVSGQFDAAPLYISSGTWSLLGTELREADCSEQSRQRNFTNEGGYDYRFRYLKNIMGLWMIQSVKKEIGGDLTFGEICELAAGQSIASIVDCNADRFLKPENMTKEIQLACVDGESGQEKPEGIAEVAAVIYNSLAKCYAAAVEELEEITERNFPEIHIVGGGANADYLNQLTANVTGKTVLAGPTEATAVGNAAAQMLGDCVWENLEEARRCIYHSFPIHVYKPSIE